MGEVTHEKLETLRACDWIVMDEIKRDGWYDQLWQSFAVLTDTKTVGVMGDQRTYQHVAAIRAVTSDDAMTADWARLPYDTLAPHLRAHRQRSPQRQPRRLRHHQQAPRHHRMGMSRGGAP